MNESYYVQLGIDWRRFIDKLCSFAYHSPKTKSVELISSSSCKNLFHNVKATFSSILINAQLL